MRLIMSGTLWVIVYLALVLSPLFILLVGPTPPGRDFWRELSVALGFAGLSITGFQFLLTARSRRITYPYGIDIVYHFHRQISLVALVLTLAHPIILFVTSPGTLNLLNLATAPWRARAGVISVLALILLIATSVWRKRMGIRYETWKALHGSLAVMAVGLALAHIQGVGYYVSAPWKKTLWLMLGIIWIGALLHIRLIRPLAMSRKPFIVETIIRERGRSWTLVLVPRGHQGFVFMPGQFVWMFLRASPFGVMDHPFSFSSSSMSPGQVHLTIRELGDFTSKISEVTPGMRVYLDGPYGVFSIDRYVAPGYTFIAGGIGITPIMSMLRTMADRRDARELVLIYANRTWDGVTFREELEELETRLNLRVVHVLENAPDNWQGETGFVTAEVLARYLPANRMEIEYFVCGPVLMMDMVEAHFYTLGIPIDRYHAERFNLV